MLLDYYNQLYDNTRNKKKRSKKEVAEKHGYDPSYIRDMATNKQWDERCEECDKIEMQQLAQKLEERKQQQQTRALQQWYTITDEALQHDTELLRARLEAEQQTTTNITNKLMKRKLAQLDGLKSLQADNISIQNRRQSEQAFKERYNLIVEESENNDETEGSELVEINQIQDVFEDENNTKEE